jgi:hypothetical protein
MGSLSTSLRWLTAALAIGGCEASVAPIQVGPGCPEQPVRAPSRVAAEPEQLIDNFESASAFLPRLGGRDGTWVLGSDGTAAQLDAESSDQCAARGQRAGHFAGHGFSSWGANWTAVLRSSASAMAVAYDATAYGGISFWAAVSTDVPAPFSLPVGVTTLDVAWNGGVCPTCMEHYYRTTISLDHVWRRFELRFADLAQSSSEEVPVAPRLEELVGVIFWPEADFDVWLDDLRFEP